MAITQTDLNISNKSYTNKDFESVYLELLDLCSKISERWSPETTNESDPGIVLLKVAAAVADKNNYNIDKNVLECFMPSATQETSMRNLCEMNGYDMKYYQSATTDLSFLYTSDIEESFTLNKFETVVTSADSSVIYTLTDNVTIDQKNVTYTGAAIEGSIKDLTIGDSTTIQLSNIDDNNRVYLPDLMVAENGIYVMNIKTNGTLDTPWTKVTNLQVQELNNTVYKFGFDSGENLPYIEFPSDIANLIGTGLRIKYIITSGADGNVSAETLNVLSAPDSIEDNTVDIQTYLSINNLSASTNGADPETVESAYSNFKKTVGTFNTLVTCRDYANYIYNLTDDDLNAVVSNIHVADRRNDFNYANNVLTYEPGNGTYLVSNTDSDDITAFDLCLYALQPISSSLKIDSYNSSFLPITKEWSETDLVDARCISHDFKDFSSTDVYAFKNYYKLSVKVGTFDKLDELQRSDLVTNIKAALMKAFNARNVDFGEEIPYDEIEKVIEDCDSRISTVILDEPELSTYVMTADGAEVSLGADGASTYREILAAKNILNGTLSLYSMADDINLDYDQVAAGTTAQTGAEYGPSIYTGLKYIASEVTIPKASLIAGYTLRENEVIQFISPNLVTSSEYGTYVNYRFEADEYVPSGQMHKLVDDEVLYIVYTDSDTSVEHKIKMTATGITDNGTYTERDVIIQPTFDLYPISEATKIIKQIVFDTNILDFWTLGSDETICLKEYVQTTLDNAVLPCYWIMNNDSNTLFDGANLETDGTTKKITVLLDSGEYFMYSNKSLTELVILGSGTRLTLTGIPSTTTKETFSNWSISEDEVLAIEDINDQGLAAFSDVNWKYKQLANNPILVEEMNIVSFSEGDTVTIKNLTSALNNTFKLLTGCTISAVLSDGTIKTLDDLQLGGVSWQGRSRLDLNSGYDTRQIIRGNQVIRLYDSTYDGSGTTGIYTLTGNDTDPLYMIFDYNVQYAGSGTPINIWKRTINGVQIEITDGLKSTVFKQYKFNSTSNPGVIYPVAGNLPDYAGLAIEYNNEDVLPISQAGFGKSVSGTAATVGDDYGVRLAILPTTGLSSSGSSYVGAKKLLMMYYNASTTAEMKSQVTVKTIGGSIKNLTTDTTAAAGATLNLTAGMNIIEIPYDSLCTMLILNHTERASTDNIFVGKIKMIYGLNPYIGSGVTEAALLTRIKTLATKDSKNIFYYLHDTDNTKSLDIHQGENLFTPRVFWDKNNIANGFTIAQIDFANSEFGVVRASYK